MILGGLQIFAGGLIGGVWLIFIGMFLRGMAEGSYLELTLRYGSPDLSLDGLISDYFLRYGYRGFPVTKDGIVLGLISLSNLKEVSEEERAEKKVGEIMAPVGREM